MRLTAEMEADVLSERLSPDRRVVWQLYRSNDRGRLALRGIVAASSTPTVIEPLTERELRALLEGEQPADATCWICARCSATNAADRRWCARCSEAS